MAVISRPNIVKILPTISLNSAAAANKRKAAYNRLIN